MGLRTVCRTRQLRFCKGEKLLAGRMKLLSGFWEGKFSSVAELQDNIALVEGFTKKPGAGRLQ